MVYCAVGYDGIDQSECEDARGCCWNDEMEVSIQAWESPYCTFGTVALYLGVFFYSYRMYPGVIEIPLRLVILSNQDLIVVRISCLIIFSIEHFFIVP